MRLLLLDNYDSFTYNLVDLLKQQANDVFVVRNDAWQADLGDFDAVVLSPGPATPNESGYLCAAVAHYAGRIPLLGVCLGHQAIGMHYGAQLVKAPQPVHGKTTALQAVQAHKLMQGIVENETVMRYHSLVIRALPPCLSVLAKSEEGLVMAMAHTHLPVYGVQYHPESILTPSGSQLMANFLGLASDFWQEKS